MSSVYARAGSVVSEIDECCPEHSDLLELLKLSGLYNKLDKEGPFTLLAPNNGYVYNEVFSTLKKFNALNTL